MMLCAAGDPYVRHRTLFPVLGSLHSKRSILPACLSLVAVRRLARFGPGLQPAKAFQGSCMARTILIVDDNSLIRRSLRSLIEDNTDWTICGEAENGRIAIEKVTQLQPAVVVLDWQMPVMNGLDAAKEISRIAPATIVIMITMHEAAMLREEAHAAGVTEVLSKTSRVAQCLIASLSRVPPAH